MLNLKEADVTQTCFYQEVLEIGRQQGQILGNHYGYKSGHKIGRKIGRQIGWKEGKANIVLRLLNRCCGQLLIAQQAQIKALPIAAIESLAEDLLDFKGMADLEIWLRENVMQFAKQEEVRSQIFLSSHKLSYSNWTWQLKIGLGLGSKNGQFIGWEEE